MTDQKGSSRRTATKRTSSTAASKNTAPKKKGSPPSDETLPQPAVPSTDISADSGTQEATASPKASSPTTRTTRRTSSTTAKKKTATAANAVAGESASAHAKNASAKGKTAAKSTTSSTRGKKDEPQKQLAASAIVLPEAGTDPLDEAHAVPSEKAAAKEPAARKKTSTTTKKTTASSSRKTAATNKKSVDKENTVSLQEETKPAAAESVAVVDEKTTSPVQTMQTANSRVASVAEELPEKSEAVLASPSHEAIADASVASPEVVQEDSSPKSESRSRSSSRRSRAARNKRNAAAKEAALAEAALNQVPTVDTAAETVSAALHDDFWVAMTPAEPEWSDIVEAASDNLEATADEGAAESTATAASKTEKKRNGRRNRGRKKSSAATHEQITVVETDADDGEEQDAVDDSMVSDAPAQSEKQKGRNKKQEESAELPAKAARRKMFVSIQPEEQVEVVLADEGQVQEYYVEMLHQAKTKGNIYKATIHNIDPNLQAAFVSYGAVKNGFLQIDEVHPEYYTSPHDGSKGRKYPPIQKVLKAGQELLVQVVKEPSGTKGAFLTTYLSMPGRFLVLTPGREQIGVSRKVEDEGERSRLRDLLEGLNPGPGLGVIVRTVSMGASKASLQADLEYLKRVWAEVRTRGTSETAPALVYQEFDLATRAVRDYLTDEVIEIWVDDDSAAHSVNKLASALFPKKRNLVRVHKESSTLFERFNLQRQIDQIQSREVSLPSGGRLVIDNTEALTAIDINSGRSGGKTNFEDMAYRTNLEAAKMIPLQLRLRDIGGQVVVDFIEMRDKSHWRDVEKTLRNGMKIDRARHDVGKISSFGLMEIVRQRLGSSAISVSTEPCPFCKGTGVRRNVEWQAQQALREIGRLMKSAEAQESAQVVYETEPALAMHLLNAKRQRLAELEQTFHVLLEIKPRHLD